MDWIPIQQQKAGNVMIRKLTTFVLVYIGLTMIMISSAYALRCGGRIVSVGDTPIQVIDKCGQPEHVETRQETRHTKDYRFYKNYRSKGWQKPPLMATETIQIEEWTYNFGPTRFMRHLIFISGRLERIEVGDKGYYR